MAKTNEPAFEQYFDAAEIKDISIETAYANTVITCAADSKAFVRYAPLSGHTKFTAELIDGKLTLKEKPSGILGLMIPKASFLTVELPEKLFGGVEFKVASGTLTAKGLTCAKLTADLASGGIDVNAFADDITVAVASGHAVFTNCTDKKAGHITIRTASGTQEFNGFGSAQTDINIASGKVRMNGISGGLKADIASGKLELDYGEWDDKLRIKVLSGKADIRLPEGSGIDVFFEGLSGSASVDLGDTHAKIAKNSDGIFGGPNVRKTHIDAVSGSVAIHN
ncbi:MAG: DUF4097 family beta strand repeat protein [Ruminiclostridium sp.]|nr:DUF4097 family beta strand repeat protein [Ruminiclostridium sp.]